MPTFSAMPAALRLQLSSVTDGSETPVTSPAILLVDSGHDFAAAAGATYVDDLPAGDEASPTGYARQALTFSGPISISSDGEAVITFTDVPFGLLGGAVDQTLGGAYIFDDTGDDATSRLLYRVPYDPQPTTDGTAFTARWGPNTARVAP
jgi:hypothetical protein